MPYALDSSMQTFSNSKKNQMFSNICIILSVLFLEKKYVFLLTINDKQHPQGLENTTCIHYLWCIIPCANWFSDVS